MNEIQQNLARLEESFTAEILKAKARWVHLCFKAIMPPEIYKLAAGDNQLQYCEAWAKNEGYLLCAHPGADTLQKNGVVVALFQPSLVSVGKEWRCVFLAHIHGRPVSVAVDNPLIAQARSANN